ncbi:hypothetical protein JXD20_01865 [Candidatus Peregrinibacteria bacterium]|nr:hypothetical protein [Candidatus Peregrinibacteria bacterium]
MLYNSEPVDRRDTDTIESEEKGRLARRIQKQLNQTDGRDYEEATEAVRKIAGYYFHIMGTNPRGRTEKIESGARWELSGNVLEALRQGSSDEEKLANVRKLIEPLIVNSEQ